MQGVPFTRRVCTGTVVHYEQTVRLSRSGNPRRVRPCATVKRLQLLTQSCIKSLTAHNGELVKFADAQSFLRQEPIFAALDAAGGFLTTTTRPTLCSDEPSPRVCISIHPEGDSGGLVRSRFEWVCSQ